MSITDPIEVTAATVQEAIAQALAQLGAPEEDVTIEVLATPRAGLLGLGARQAKVRVMRRPQLAATSGVQSPPPAPARPAPQARPAMNQQQAREPRPARNQDRSQDRRQERPPDRQQQGQREERREDRRDEPRPVQSQDRREDRREDRRAPRSSAAQAPLPQAQREARSRADNRGDGEHGADLDENPEAPRRSADLEQQAREGAEILTRILELMGEKAEVARVIDAEPDSLELEIKADGSGLLIGRHGQTLDALEYVVNRIVAHRIRDAAPIVLETEAYRARRRQQLHRMALSMGERAKRDHQSVTLEPMPPRDRRVVHLALKEDPMLTTRSSGDGFLRAIEIVPVGAPPHGRGGNGPDPGPGSGPGPGRRRRRERGRGGEGSNDAIGEQGGFKHGQKRIV
ncbi:MAG TPA: RNA-binding cell elongation regulator Jag/EloR [Candidatus Binataceae bacterium]|nr:RNA-binding cell elongation regulator Jag/EloR [Candidatus Binataceae bacterium]